MNARLRRLVITFAVAAAASISPVTAQELVSAARAWLAASQTKRR